MSNMSYCRFENIYRDLQDCLESLQNTNLDELSDTEKVFAIKLVKMCKEISDDFIDEIEEFENKPQCSIIDVDNSYCVRRHMFFAATYPIIEDNLTKEQADILCKNLNDKELDKTYVYYVVHK